MKNLQKSKIDTIKSLTDIYRISPETKRGEATERWIFKSDNKEYPHNIRHPDKIHSIYQVKSSANSF